MQKVHITLVGGQAAVVYNAIMAIKPDFVVYVYSYSTKHVVENVKNEIDLPSEEINLNPTDPAIIKAQVEQLAEKYKDDEVTVNISSGLKSWSYFFSIVFNGYPNAQVVYMDQNNVLWNYRDMTSTSDFEFDMKVQFRLYGNSIENNYKDFSDYSEEDIKLIQKIEDVRAFNYQDFKRLTAVLDKKQQAQVRQDKFGRLNCNESYVEWNRSDDLDLPFVRIYLTKKDQFIEEVIESKYALDMVFNSGWFELKVANLMAGWEHAKQVFMNVRFPYKDNVDKNETDVIVNTGTKLIFVECKTQIAKTTDIDKFRSVVKNYGGLGSKGIFITSAKMNDIARKKCKDNGILFYSLEDFHPGGMAQELYALLNKELFNINAK